MNEKVLNYFKRHSIQINDIKYLTRKDGKTCIHMIDNRISETYITVKDFLASMESYDFICINKGTVVSKKQISYIKDGIYYMMDGASFRGRKKNASAHKRLNASLHKKITSEVPSFSDIQTMFSMLDNIPIAFCVIELVFNKDGLGVDFVFRYCNKQMEYVEGKKIDEMVNHSFYTVFPNADKKWLVTYTDVAINGSYRCIRDFSTEIEKDLFIQCFQPIKGFCGCLITPVDEMLHALPADTTHSI